MKTFFKNNLRSLMRIYFLIILKGIFLKFIVDQNTSLYKKIIILFIFSILLILSKFNKLNKFIYFLTILFYIFYLLYRNPEILMYGRFFAEEGAIYWSYSLSHSRFETLLYTPVIAGYYLFFTNFLILLTTYFPLEVSPLITVWFSILFSLLPSLLFFLLTKNKFNEVNRILISQILIFLPSLNYLETFANSINIQTYLGVSVFIIYIYGLNNEKKYINFIENIVILFGSLSGYYSIILFPVLLVRKKVNKNIKIFTPVVVWITGVFVQLNILIFTLLNDVLYGDKFTNKLQFTEFLIILKKSSLVNIFTEYFLRDSFIQNLSIFVLFSFIFLLIKKDKMILFIILLSFFLEVFLVMIGQAGQDFTGRYATVPSTIIFFIFLHYLLKSKNSYVILILFFCIGLLNTSYQNGNYFISCNSNCEPWAIQLKNNPRSITHWPIGEGDPFWTTNLENPKPNPAPFQIKLIGENIDYLYSLTLLDIISENYKMIVRD